MPKEALTYEEAHEVGYFGVVPDDTPNEAYTVSGVIASDEAATADRKAAAGQATLPPDPTAEPAPTKSASKKTG